MYPGIVVGGEARPLTMPDVTPVVYIVDDDISVREALEALIREAGWRPWVFASAKEFLSHPRISCPSCRTSLVLQPDSVR
jgi:FixJ family two-component response regulator